MKEKKMDIPEYKKITNSDTKHGNKKMVIQEHKKITNSDTKKDAWSEEKKGKKSKKKKEKRSQKFVSLKLTANDVNKKSSVVFFSAKSNILQNYYCNRCCMEFETSKGRKAKFCQFF